jgi:4-hydroxy-3-polyprenylbenzoate decarboxylase
LLRGKKVELVDCKTVPLKVPAEAEIVLEGQVSLDEYGDEGLYGDTPVTTTASRSSRVHRSAITMRRNLTRSTTAGRLTSRRCWARL